VEGVKLRNKRKSKLRPKKNTAQSIAQYEKKYSRPAQFVMSSRPKKRFREVENSVGPI
jgi:hypothetical protein